MSAPVRLLLKDLVTRGGWILLALCCLQFLFAMSVLNGWGPRSTSTLATSLMVCAFMRLPAPSRRLVVTLPLTRKTVERMQWLYGGGLVAICMTAMSLLAWIFALIQAAAPPLWAVVLLILGTPGAVGLSMILRRWMAGAIHPNNQVRPVVLSIFVPVATFMIGNALLQYSLVMALPIALVLSAGWGVLLVFYFSPQNYYQWIERTHTALHIPTRRHGYWPTGPWLATALLGVASGGTLGAIHILLSTTSGADYVPKLTFAVIGMFLTAAYLHNIKLLRTLPWSLSQCAAYIATGYLTPVLATLLTLSAACMLNACSPSANYAVLILPFLGAISPVAAGYVHFSLVGSVTTLAGSPVRRGILWVYLLSVVALAFAERILTPFCIRHPLLANLLGVAIIGAVFLAIRRQIATHMLEQRSQSSAYLAAA